MRKELRELVLALEEVQRWQRALEYATNDAEKLGAEAKREEALAMRDAAIASVKQAAESGDTECAEFLRAMETA